METSLASEADSPRNQIPTSAVPAAPSPVDTAYAEPTSSFFSAMVSSPKPISAHTAKPTVGHSLVIPWLCFSKTAEPVSNSRATTTKSQAIT
jgi:hypothetical protein